MTNLKSVVVLLYYKDFLKLEENRDNSSGGISVGDNSSGLGCITNSSNISSNRFLIVCNVHVR